MSGTVTRFRRGWGLSVAVGLVLLALPACQIPGLRPAAGAQPLPDSYGAPGGTSDTTKPLDSTAQVQQPVLPVQAFYTDPALTALLTQALAGNQELKILDEEVQIAANEVRARQGAILPAVGLEAGGGFERSSAFTPLGAAERQLTTPRGREFPDPLPRVRVGAVLNWQVDLWRELRNAREAAVARLTAASERRNAYVTRLIAEVADNYYQLLALDGRFTVLDQIIEIQEKTLAATVALMEAGRVTDLPVQRFKAEVQKNRSEKLIVRQEQVEVENRINFLLGRFPQPVQRTAGNYADLTLAPPAAGLPAQLLRSRPDIRQAERELTAAGLDVLVARARFFPRLDITAGIGWEAFNPRYLFDPGSFIASAVGGVVAPLVNRAAIKADYQSANARQLQALYNYQRVILDAVKEVATQLAAADNYRQSVEVKKEQLKALEKSVDSATKLFQAARAEYSEVLFAQRDLLEARTVLIDTKRRQLAATVAAYQALGGGDPAAGTTLQPLPGATLPPQP